MATPLPAFMFVFSAHAEVVPFKPERKLCDLRILRARGGSSILQDQPARTRTYSPRTRR